MCKYCSSKHYCDQHYMKKKLIQYVFAKSEGLNTLQVRKFRSKVQFTITSLFGAL